MTEKTSGEKAVFTQNYFENFIIIVLNSIKSNQKNRFDNSPHEHYNISRKMSRLARTTKETMQ